MLGKKYVLSGLLLLGVLLAGPLGCKNVCTKAAEHVVDCIKDYCASAESDDIPQCENVEALESALAGNLDCSEPNRLEAEETQGWDCEEIVEMALLEEAPEGEEAEEAEEEEGEAEEGH